MGAILQGVIIGALSNVVTKIISIIGLTLISYKGIKIIIQSLLDFIVPTLSQLPTAIINILELAGMSEALTILASAALTRAAILSAQAFVSLLE